MRMRQQNSTSTLRLDPERSIRSQIAGYYRDRIVRGELRPGDRLPPARTLARELGVAEANVHHAFGKLAGEGLLIRRPRAGSVVARREPGLRGVAVFVPWRSLMRGEEFTRLLVRFLAARFEESGVECHVLYDTPGGTGWNGLRRLASERRIQGVICRTIEPDELKFYQALHLPFTGIGSLRIANRISLLTAELIGKMAEALRATGCRSFGVIIPERPAPGFLPVLRRCGAAAALEFREEWLYDGSHSAESFIVDRAAFAWNAVAHLNTLRRRPEGLMLFSDDLVEGVTMAFYRAGVRVPQDYRLAIHHTRENPVIFPFACTLVQHSIAEIAGALAEQLADLCSGKVPRAPALDIALTPYTPPVIAAVESRNDDPQGDSRA